MKNIQTSRKRGGAFPALMLLACLLASCAAGCSPGSKGGGGSGEKEIEPRVYTIQELAELASPAVAYIEAPCAADPRWSSFGSGFVVRPDGIIITNYHVMEGAGSAIVEVGGRSYTDVSVLAFSEEWDLAVLKIEARNLTALSLGRNLDEVKLGEPVVAMGNPQGFKGSVSNGIVSTVRRDVGLGFDLIQTTAPISKGSSGGPLLNMRGEVIGVNTLTYTEGQNLNFAVPSDLVRRLLNNLGPPQAVAAVFGAGAQAPSTGTYSGKAGEFAVVLSWQGPADLDLEIWDEDFNFLGVSSLLGDGPDIANGTHGEEWFVFKKYPDKRGTRDSDQQWNFSRGRYIVSPYYYGPEGGSGPVEATVSIHFPDGRRETISRELLYEQPYDQWFAILVDVSRGSFKILDFFLEGELVALLEWDSAADLDLAVWSYELGEAFFPFNFGGYDFTGGDEGLEVFWFDIFPGTEGKVDFTTGTVDVLVLMDNPGQPVTRAVVTFVTADFSLSRFEHLFTPDPKGDYWWQVLLDLDLETLDFIEPPEEKLRFYF